MTDEFMNTIVNFTPTGMIPTKSLTPHVPISCQEIVEDVLQAHELGITMVHLHVRDENTQQPDYHKERYAQVIEGIRRYAQDLVICVSTSGRSFQEMSMRADVLGLTDRLKPDMASLTLSSLNFNSQASINDPTMVQNLASIMLERGIKPELEIFDSGMANYAKYLIRKKILCPPFYANLILGNIACAQADLLHIGVLVHDLPDQTLVSMGGVGNAQFAVNSLAIAMGYGVRIGLEDNIWYDQARTRLAGNRQLVARVLEIVRANEREVMLPAEFRRMMHLAPGGGLYGTEGS